jgi:D-arabinose 1-dehydrogenase-like Zn-dependent alcohol dehydrogenase
MNLKNITENKYFVYGAVGLGAYFIYKQVRKALGFNTTVDAAKKDQAELVRAGQRASYVDSQYKIFADAIYSAGFDVLFGTDEDAIYNVFNRMNNDLDVNKLIVAFGARRIEFSTRVASLSEFLRSELDDKEIANINKILSTKNINYRF